VSTKLADIYEQIPGVTCPEGCGECCGPVFPSLAEIRNIKNWCALHHIEYREFLNIETNGDCPYLTPVKRCIIYPVRPFLCRILGGSTALSCPLKKCQARRLLTQSQTDALYKAIYLRGKEKPRTEKHRQLIREALGF
jgi:Fe-S-cluster containining protein